MTMRLAWRRTRPTALIGARAMGKAFGGETLALGVALVLAGCSGDTMRGVEPITDPTQFFMRLVLNYGAVNLSTAPGYETFQLTSTPLNALGEPMSGLPTPTFFSSDTSRVTVSPTGLLTALKAGSNIQVITELTTSDNVHHADTAMVNVVATNPPPELATLTIAPAPPDSAILPLRSAAVKGDTPISLWYNATFGSSKPRLKNYLRTLTAGGTNIPGLQVEYLTLDPDVIDVQRRGNGQITTYNPGLGRVVVRAVVYGVPKADTTVFTVTTSVAQGVFVSGTTVGGESIFQPSVVIVRQNGVVYWADYRGPIGVVFDDPAAVSLPPASICDVAITGGGLGPAFEAPRVCDADFTLDSTTFNGFYPTINGYRARQFPIPGTYTYRDTLSGFTGQVIVTDSVTPAP